MYTKDADSYFIVDSHTHYWDASPENWVTGQEAYAKGWIECFHAYMGLGPADTHWPMEKFQKYSEDDLMRDLFDAGYVDVAIFQPTYLTEWYSDGFNTTERNGALAEKHPGKFIVNTAWDPRDGDAGLEELEAKVERWQPKGVKLYTAEWKGDSRGWKLTDAEAYRYLAKSEELGITNIHVHKGPTIWPLDKDAFDVADVDHAATDFPNLNFIVEHVGLPRIEDLPGRWSVFEAAPLPPAPRDGIAATGNTDPSRVDQLSPREREVLTAVGTGASNAQIAAALFMSEATVKAHVSHLFTKLGLVNRVQLALYSHRVAPDATVRSRRGMVAADRPVG